MKDGITIYIHIPYCKSKCVYCSFVSFADRCNEIPMYIERLKKELRLRAEQAVGKKVFAVYFGGGTPSLLNPKQIKGVLDEIRAHYDLSENAEITIEMNPAANNAYLINRLTEIGVNRVSVGFQTSDDGILKELKRPHTRADFIATVNKLKRAGLTNISTDIMLGLPHQNMSTIRRTLDILLKFEVPHISAYALKLERGTPLYKAVNNGHVYLPDDDESADMYDYVYKTLESNKIYRYEVSNFSKVGYECRHNINYWERGHYIGVGLNAHGFVEDTRYSNLRDMEKYIARLDADKLPTSVRNKMTLKESEFEYIMLNLRMDRGLDVDKFNEAFYTDFLKRYDKLLRRLQTIGVITYDEHNVAVRPEKMGVLNSVLTEFLAD